MGKRIKNALRVHEIAPWPTTGDAPGENDYLELAAGIESITDDTDEDIDDTVFYDSDGTPSNDVTGISEVWTVEGQRDYDDPAQNYVDSIKRKLLDDRRAWHRITYTNGKVVEGPCKITNIVAGGGDAGSYEDFSCVLNYSRIPTVTEGTAGEGSGA